jgi:hypothetical protein
LRLSQRVGSYDRTAINLHSSIFRLDSYLIFGESLRRWNPTSPSGSPFPGTNPLFSVSNQRAPYRITVSAELSFCMNLLSQSWDLRMLWLLLPLQTKLFFFCLFLATIYMAFSLTVIYLQSRSVPPKGTEPLLNSHYLGLLRRIHNLRQLQFMFFLVFCLALTDEIFRAFQAFERSKWSLSASTAAEAADPVLCFTFCCLIIFTSLHLLQWLVSNRIEKIVSISP